MAVQPIVDNIYYIVFLISAGNVLLSSAIIFFYVRYQRRFFRQRAELQQSELQHKQKLLHATIKSQEDERTRISRDLHDHIGSSLAELRMMTSQVMHAGGPTSDAKYGIDECKHRIDSIIEDVRDIAHSLSPAGLSIWGLLYSLEEFCEKMAAASNIDISIEDDTNNVLQNLHFDIALSLFRVIQELVTNTIKHAAASTVSINIKGDTENVVIEYKDDGKGMHTKHTNHGIGLYNIENRLSIMQAKYTCLSAPAAGYLFIIELGIDKTPAEKRIK